jgi:hypothetical protein
MRLGRSLDSHSKHLAARAALVRRCPQVICWRGVRRDAGMQLSRACGHGPPRQTAAIRCRSARRGPPGSPPTNSHPRHRSVHLTHAPPEAAPPATTHPSRPSGCWGDARVPEVAHPTTHNASSLKHRAPNSRSSCARQTPLTHRSWRGTRFLLRLRLLSRASAQRAEWKRCVLSSAGHMPHPASSHTHAQRLHQHSHQPSPHDPATGACSSPRES